MNELVSKLKSKLESEQNDNAAYQEIADLAEEHGYYGCAAILRDIAHEESVHHRHLQNLIYMLTADRE